MKLYVDQLPGDGLRGQSFAVYNERGEKLPCVTAASVHHDMDGVARLVVELVVNGSDIVFGKPPVVVGDVHVQQRPEPSRPLRKA